MFSTDLYINSLTKKELNKKKYSEIYFGIINGLFLLFVSIFRLITDSNIKNDKFYILLLILSIIDFIILIFFPNQLFYIKNVVSLFGKIISRIIISIILIIIYIIWFIPASIICYTQKNSGNTTLREKNTNIIKVNNNNVFLQVKNLFLYFLLEDNWYLLPLIMILVIIGLVLFFAQSSAITPLIYPLI